MFYLVLFSILSHYCNSLPVYRERIRKGKEQCSLEFTTRSLPCFTELYHMFYPDKTKIIPNNIYDLLTPVALAHVIMGDGSFHPVNGGLLICTDSYSIKEVVNLMNVLIIRYNLTCSIRQHNKGQYRVSIHKQSIKSLAALVKPYMDPSFYYKIGEVDK